MFRFLTAVTVAVLAVAFLDVATADLLEDCHLKGFDPYQLSCDTCLLLQDTPHLMTTCQQCCQEYKGTKNTATRYATAILLHSPGSSDEIDTFLREDLPTLENKAQILVRPQESAGGPTEDMRFMMMMGYMSKSSSILWLAETPSSSLISSKTTTTVAALKKLAKEEIDLRGWKRDDIKSMLQTLLA